MATPDTGEETLYDVDPNKISFKAGIAGALFGVAGGSTLLLANGDASGIDFLTFPILMIQFQVAFWHFAGYAMRAKAVAPLAKILGIPEGSISYIRLAHKLRWDKTVEGYIQVIDGVMDLDHNRTHLPSGYPVYRIQRGLLLREQTTEDDLRTIWDSALNKAISVYDLSSRLSKSEFEDIRKYHHMVTDNQKKEHLSYLYNKLDYLSIKG